MASSSKFERIYHVFLSFRGEDVRNNFLSHLYRALDQKGIYTFVDSEELGKGEQIAPALMKAIEESHIAIIIFSKDYASSRCCLDELAKIMDCKEERNLMVFPVFYKVEPKEVKTPREKYREAMIKHESKIGTDSYEVKRWKKALFDAGSLYGWHLKDGDESKFIQRIVMEISSRLDRTPLHVAKYPVGIDSQVVTLKSMLNLWSDDDVLMVGLWGKGGIGKTALAKAVYNGIFDQFGNSCFLANVREVSKDCKDIVTLQEKLLFQILELKERLVVSSVDGGINQIQYRLCHKKVLLILDDVDDRRQLDALAGESKWFGNGSRIIITTRDIHLLTSHGIDLNHVYKVRELDDGAAHELLSKHAFLNCQKFKIRTDLVDGVLNHAKGLPLALEVLGSFLRGRREDEWESTLAKISKFPKKDINDVLKISYDGLEANEKEIFLHIACFFKGWTTEYIKKVLKSCDLVAIIGLRVLNERCLIRMESRNIQMHDLIQLMGMDIVNKESKDPWRRSRLWSCDDVADVVSNNMGDCAVEAIVLEPLELTEIYVSSDALTKMRRLRLLILQNVHNSFQGPIYLPNELRWIRLDGCAPQISKFSSGRKKLVGLHMSNCSTVVPNQLKDFQNLKYIIFNDCKSLVCTPDIVCTPNLEELDISNCTNLVEAHESIAFHDKLQVLNLMECFELSVFPNLLKSKKLRTLNIKKCTKFERFPDIPCKLEDLKKLWLEGTGIKELPASIENLVSLEGMYIQDCKSLEHLPSCIYKLQNLKHLQVSYCINLNEFPKYKDSVDPCMKTGLSNLYCLDLTGCNLSEVEFLGNLSCFPVLVDLNLTENNIIALPTSISKRGRLSQLGVENCLQLQEIPELPPFLSYLWADNCKLLQKNEGLNSIHHFVHRGLVDTRYPLGQYWFEYGSLLCGGEMPHWILPIEMGSLSFKASKDLYDKFLGIALSFVSGIGHHDFKIALSVDGKQWSDGPIESSHSLDSDHVALLYFRPFQLWGVIDFGQIDRNDVEFGVTI
ncbi:TMV resistance protein N-like [Eucalyptus grandis]|uniref:TMV resistance protein N-like n=1 Tax=Eucalyptus grandis TaxID=71139 RepID=UPI00192EAE6B|nr:TMV resistance protein N-like [Eucalyptus grandis]